MGRKARELRQRSPASLVVVLLLVSLLLAGLLAWQAQDAARSHRAAAETVLRDYAALAAAELVRRGSSQVGYYGYAALIDDLRQRAAESGPPPSPEDLAESADPRVEAALPLLDYTFRFRPGPGGLSVVGRREAPEVAQEVRARLDRISPRAGELVGRHAVLHGKVEDGSLSYTVVVTATPQEGEETPGLLGFGVNLEALPEAFAAAMEQGSLLPAPLGNGELGNEILSLKVINPVGRVVFARGGGSYPVDPDLEAAVPFADTYRAVLDGWEVRAAVDPAYARELIIGGLPRTRLPLLLGLMALAAGLVAVALRQVRREKELARLRSEFVSRVSHELRTPLTQIRMFAETLLLKRVRSVAEEEKALRVIDRESRRLSHLVENILQFSRGERGDLRLSPRPRLLEPFVEELVEEVRPLADRVNLALDLEPGLEASVDGDALRQVLLNLLDNALKYGPAGQTVTVGLGAAGPRRLRLWVEDQGPGVPESQRERIWERFHRLERDRRSAVAGTGIGLAVVRDLVRQHGGEVWVEAAHRWGREARGARFIVELPRIVGESEVPAAHPVEAAP